MKYIVLLTNAEGCAQVIGNQEGSGFTTEHTADVWAKKYAKAYPLLRPLVLPITALSIQTVPAHWMAVRY